MLLRHRHCVEQLTRSSYKRACDFLAFPDHERETEIESHVQHDLGNTINFDEDWVILASCSNPNITSVGEHMDFDEHYSYLNFCSERW